MDVTHWVPVNTVLNSGEMSDEAANLTGYWPNGATSMNGVVVNK